MPEMTKQPEAIFKETIIKHGLTAQLEALELTSASIYLRGIGDNGEAVSINLYPGHWRGLASLLAKAEKYQNALEQWGKEEVKENA